MSEISREEIQYSKMVQKFIDDEIERLSNLTTELEDAIMAEGRKFSLDNPYASSYGGSEVSDHLASLEKKVQLGADAKFQINVLRRIRSHPYFARIDFKEDGYDTDRFYIGIRSLYDIKEIAPYVYDWRAPIASLFYEDFEDGKAYYDAPVGRIEGTIEKRFQYKFKNGELYSCFESEMNIDDAILQSALKESSTDRLKVIVSSIQKEQNRAIRFGGNKNLVVFGPAGSGKTSVGFHRLAYLLYVNRDFLTSSEIVMFTNSDIFSSYVSDIIPELGEAPIKEFNFYKLMSRQLGGRKYRDYYDLTEAILNGDKKREAAAAVKYSKEFTDFLENYILNRKIKFSGFSLYGKEVYSGEELSDYLMSMKKTRIFSEKMELLKDFAEDKINCFFAENYEMIYDILNEESSIIDDTAEMVIELHSEIKNRACQQIRSELDGNDFMILSDAFEKYEAETGSTLKLAKHYRQDLGRNMLNFEDALLVLFIKYVFGKLPAYSDVRHVLIDEAQDFSPVQHRIIRAIYPRAYFTILTDSRQAIFPLINSTDISEIADVYSAEVLELNKSYRSTKQINSFAKQFLENADYETFDRDGDEPEVIETDDALAEIKKRLDGIEGSACIITKTTALAEKLYKELRGNLNVELYNDKEMYFSGRIGIMPVTYTKGLEFDNVIIVSDGENDFYAEGSEPFLYMAATRALHRLTAIKS